MHGFGRQCQGEPRCSLDVMCRRLECTYIRAQFFGELGLMDTGEDGVYRIVPGYLLIGNACVHLTKSQTEHVMFVSFY